MKVYGIPRSRSTRVTWMLEELNQDYEFMALDFEKGDNRTEEYLAISPAGKVPVLVDGDLVLLESAAILSYLGRKLPESKLVPEEGTKERALYDQWSYFTLCELEQPLWTIGKHTFVLPENKRNADIIPLAQWEFQRVLDLFSDGLGDKPYILGDSFYAVDILLGHTLSWAKAFKQPIEHKNLVEYMGRVLSRPALKKASEKEKAS